MIETVPGSDAGMVIDQLRVAAVVEGTEGTRHLGHVGCGARRIPLIPCPVAANDQLARLRLLGVHHAAIYPTFSSHVVITGALPQAGRDGPNSQPAVGVIDRDALWQHGREMRWRVDGRNRGVADEPRLPNRFPISERMRPGRTRRDLPRRQPTLVTSLAERI
jgi:hypothetical protein